MSLSPYDESSRPPVRTRGQRRRRQIAEAAAELVREEGPAALSHRQVAQRAECSLSATTYYFSGLDDLRAAAYEVVVEEWAARAIELRAEIAEQDPDQAIDPAAQLVNVTLPPGDVDQLCGFLETIVGAGRLPKAAARVAEARQEILKTLRVCLDLHAHQHDWSAEVVLALIDGASCDALSEGTDPRQHAAELVANALGFGGIDGSGRANPVVSDSL